MDSRYNDIVNSVQLHIMVAASFENGSSYHVARLIETPFKGATIAIYLFDSP